MSDVGDEHGGYVRAKGANVKCAECGFKNHSMDTKRAFSHIQSAHPGTSGLWVDDEV